MRALGLRGLLGTLALAILPAPAGAQAVGSEFQINTYTTSHQRTVQGGHVVASDASGNFVVVWTSSGQDGSLDGIFGRRYASEGGALGIEFRVNSYTTNLQRFPSVASDASGNFVVVWQSNAQDGSGYGIFGQRYDSAGVPRGTEFQINSFTSNSTVYPSVAAAADGDFVVVWANNDQDGSEYGVFGQRFDSEGVAQGDEFQVNSYTTNSQWFPSVASDASGNFVVVWASYTQDGSRYGIFGQRYDSAGVPRGSEFQINSYTTDDQWTFPDVSADANGNFVVVWKSSGQDSNYSGIFGQRFDSAGVPQGTEFRVNSFTTGGTHYPSVACDASGNFVVAWEDTQDGSGIGVSGQHYDSGGVPEGDEFQINTFTTSWQQTPSVAVTGTDQFVVAWESLGQDGSSFGVFGQRLAFAGDTITVQRPNTNVRWRIGSVHSIQWTHNLGQDATFRIELDRDDDGGYEERIAVEAPADSATRGHFAWTVTGPVSAAARVRVSWTANPGVADTSDVTFEIRPG